MAKPQIRNASISPSSDQHISMSFVSQQIVAAGSLFSKGKTNLMFNNKQEAYEHLESAKHLLLYIKTKATESSDVQFIDQRLAEIESMQLKCLEMSTSAV